MSLLEVMIASFVVCLITLGIVATIIGSRTLTEGSVAQGMAQTIANGYMEQMRGMSLSDLVTTDSSGNLVTTSYEIPTQSDANTSDPLYTSTGSPPSIKIITPGTTPSGVVDNLKSFVVNKSVTPAQVSWSSVWPNAQNYPSTTVGRTDLKMDIWIWITDLSNTGSGVAKAYGITMIYTWQFSTNGGASSSVDGSRAYGGQGGTSYGVGIMRTIRSSVPTFSP